MDLTESIAPRSDQINADDLIAGPMTVTVTEVRAGSAEQPVSILTAETPGRPYKPSKSMRRVLVTAWGAESANYVGRRMTLYRNAQIKFGGDTVGGIEISNLSDIPKRVSIALTVTRGKKKAFSVDPLPNAPKPIPDPTPDQITACTDPDTLRAWWAHSSPATRELINARGTALKDAEHTPA